MKGYSMKKEMIKIPTTQAELIAAINAQLNDPKLEMTPIEEALVKQMKKIGAIVNKNAGKHKKAQYEIELELIPT